MICHDRHVRRPWSRVRLALVLCGAAGFAHPASASPIDPGTLYLKAEPTSHWDFSVEPIAADFFGPGSDPFDGRVAVITATKVARPQGAVFHGAASQTIPVEMVSLTLHSQVPIEVTYEAGTRSSFFDVFITLDRRGALPAGANKGEFSLSHNLPGQPDGGTIGPVDSFFDVFFDLTFTNQLDDTDVVHLQRRQQLVLSNGVPWAHAASALYARPDSGGFYPGVDPSGPPGDRQPETMVYEGTELTWKVRLAVVPEPSTLALVALGILGAIHRLRRQVRAV